MAELSEPQVIRFNFQVRQVKSMADHSVNVTLNLPEYCQEQAGQLLKLIDAFGEAALVLLDKDDKSHVFIDE
jgi:hypothetical protein